MTIREALNNSECEKADVYTVNQYGDIIDLFYIDKYVESIFDELKCEAFYVSEIYPDTLYVKINFMEIIDLLLWKKQVKI